MLPPEQAACGLQIRGVFPFLCKPQKKAKKPQTQKTSGGRAGSGWGTRREPRLPPPPRPLPPLEPSGAGSAEPRGCPAPPAGPGCTHRCCSCCSPPAAPSPPSSGRLRASRRRGQKRGWWGWAGLPAHLPGRLLLRDGAGLGAPAAGGPASPARPSGRAAAPGNPCAPAPLLPGPVSPACPGLEGRRRRRVWWQQRVGSRALAQRWDEAQPGQGFLRWGGFFLLQRLGEGAVEAGGCVSGEVLCCGSPAAGLGRGTRGARCEAAGSIHAQERWNRD